MAATARATAVPTARTSRSCSRPLLAAVAPGRRASGSTAPSARAAMPAGCSRPGPTRVIGVDRDPARLRDGARLGRAVRRPPDASCRARSRELDTHAGGPLDGVVLDLGVSSMQLDQAERGFSFLRDGPLDMRMGAGGPTAADIVNARGRGRAGRHPVPLRRGARLAPDRPRHRRARAPDGPSPARGELAEIVEGCLPRPKPGQSHPATRSFQALRIAVNDEFGELVAGLEAAERALKPGGLLAVVSFHSLEDRVVKRFLQVRSGAAGRRQPLRTRDGRGARRASTLVGEGDRRRRGRACREPARPVGAAADRAPHRRARRSRRPVGARACRNLRSRRRLT